MTELRRVGDPEAMRVLARELLARGDALAEAEAAVAKLAGATFEGPAADRLRGRARAAAEVVRAADAGLRAAAQALLVGAERVETDNAALERAAARDQAGEGSAHGTDCTPQQRRAPASPGDAGALPAGAPRRADPTGAAPVDEAARAAMEGAT